jgi:hypothetical protein
LFSIRVPKTFKYAEIAVPYVLLFHKVSFTVFHLITKLKNPPCTHESPPIVILVNGIFKSKVIVLAPESKLIIFATFHSNPLHSQKLK